MAFATASAAYSPSWIYLGYLAGFLPKSRVQDVQIVMGPGWYPILNSESFPGSELLKRGRPRTVFIQMAWPMPWLKNDLTVLRYSDSEALNMAKAKDSATFSKEYSWGRVHFFQDIELAYVDGRGVALSSQQSFSQLRAAVDEIREITKATN